MPRSEQSRDLPRARWAVAALFFLNGAIYANLVPRLPEIKAALDLSNAAFGAGVAAMPVGALMAGLLAPWFIGRWGSGRVAAVGMAAVAVAVGAVPLAGAWVGFAAALLAAGASDSIADVAQNTHGFRVQRAFGRSLMNGFHALWSIGAVAGGLIGAAAAGAGVPLTAHMAASTIGFVGIALLTLPNLLPGPDRGQHVEGADTTKPSEASRRIPGRTVWMLAVLGVLAACEAFIQDAGSSWGALYLRDSLGTGAALAGAAFIAMQVAMTGGRLVGDRLVDRFGQRRVARLGGILAAAGMAYALLRPSVPSVVLGFALAGLGVATLYPAVMHTADELPGLRPGAGIAVVSWLLRTGFLLSPLVVGVIADRAGLGAALWTMVGAGLTVAVIGRVLLKSGSSPASRSA